MLQRRDYVMRMIRQLGDALAKVLKLRKEGRHDEAMRTIEETLRDLFGEVVDLAEKVDEATAASLFGGADAIHAYARLLEERAEVRQELLDVPHAEADRARALAMHLEALQMAVGRRDPAVVASTRVLATRVDVDRLSARHQALLASLH